MRFTKPCEKSFVVVSVAPETSICIQHFYSANVKRRFKEKYGFAVSLWHFCTFFNYMMNLFKTLILIIQLFSMIFTLFLLISIKLFQEKLFLRELSIYIDIILRSKLDQVIWPCLFFFGTLKIPSIACTSSKFTKLLV